MLPRTFTGHQMLAHRPMTLAQFRAAMGLTVKQAGRTMEVLLGAGVVERKAQPGTSRYVYRAVA